MGRVLCVARPRRHLLREPTAAGLRRGARSLRRRQCIFRLRSRVPLLDVADETADASLLATRLAAVLRSVARAAEPLAPRRAVRREHRRAAVHRETIASPVRVSYLEDAHPEWLRQLDHPRRAAKVRSHLSAIPFDQ